MKKNKKRLIFMLLIIVMLMGITSTAFASATYAGTFRYRIYETANSVSFNSYVRDINSFCKKFGEATYGSYESYGLYYDEDDDEYIRYRSCPGYSGETRTHYKYTWIDSDRAKLGFDNTWCYGTLLAIGGTIE